MTAKAKLLDPNNSELMAINALEREGDTLVIRGEIYGAMPMKAVLRPEDLRAILRMLTPRLAMFLLTLPFRQLR